MMKYFGRNLRQFKILLLNLLIIISIFRDSNSLFCCFSSLLLIINNQAITIFQRLNIFHGSVLCWWMIWILNQIVSNNLEYFKFMHSLRRMFIFNFNCKEYSRKEKKSIWDIKQVRIKKQTYENKIYLTKSCEPRILRQISKSNISRFKCGPLYIEVFKILSFRIFEITRF